MITKIINEECKSVVYIPPPEYGAPDYHLVKLTTTYEDGKVEDIVKLIKDYQRSFWITRKGAQNHKSKKEWEDLTNLIEYKTTQSKMEDNIKRAVQRRVFNGQLKKLIDDVPYIYGSDIKSTALIKADYIRKYKYNQSIYKVAVQDTETDVINGTEQIIMMTVTMGSTCFTAVQKSFLEGVPNATDRFYALMDKYLSEVLTARNIKPELVIVDDEVSVVKAVMKKTHEIKPDIVTFWNMDFDIKKIMAAFKNANEDIADTFCDPIVPKAYRFFKYIPGPDKKITDSGKVKPNKPHERWNVVVCPCSFQFVDAMCAYKQLRIAKPEERSYKLNSILSLELGIRKLNFKEADHLADIDLHKFMQTYYKLEYIVYNTFDCISIELLDEKTTDLRLSFPMQAGYSDYGDFNKQPRKTVDQLHYFLIDEFQKVIGSTGSEMADELDKEIWDLRGWIVALEASLIQTNGLRIIEELPDKPTKIYGFAGDLDVSAALNLGPL